MAALHGRRRRAGLQPAAAALHLLRSLRWPAHDAAADDRDGAARPACRERGAAAGRSVETVDGQPVRYWEELEHEISVSAGKTLRFGIRRGPDAEERDVTPIEIERTGPLHRKERLGWIGVSPRFHLPEIGVLDPSSPAALAGLKTFDFITAVNGVPVATWTEFARAVERAGASPLRLNYVRGGYSAVPFAHIEIEEPGSAVVIPVAVFDTAGRRHYETGILSAELFVFSVEPGSPADRIGLRRGDQILSTRRRAAGALGRPARAAGQPSRTRTSASAGSRRPASITRRAFARRSGRELDVNRQEEQRLVFGALNRLAWKTEVPVPITEPVRLRVRPRVQAHRRDHLDDGLRLRRDPPRPRAADDAGRPDHDRLRGRRRRRAGAGPVPVVDGGHQRQPGPVELPARADPRRRAAGVLHAGAVQATSAVAARAPDRHQRRPGHRRRADACSRCATTLCASSCRDR